jgi:hypothetical protein
VIDDSVPWKEARAHQQRWVERTGYLLERDIMLGAFSVRKLVDSRKVSQHVESLRWPVARHLLNGRVPDMLNRWHFWESFDVERGRPSSLKTVELCNAVIHSFVFAFNADERTELWDGIFVTSDWRKRDCLYFVPVESLVGLFRAVGSDDVVSAVMTRDKRGEMQVTVLSSAHPQATP